jgi:hypothetical protein
MVGFRRAKVEAHLGATLVGARTETLEHRDFIDETKGECGEVVGALLRRRDDKELPVGIHAPFPDNVG